MHRNIFVLSLIVAAFCGLYSWKFLVLKTDRADLVDDKYAFHQRWLQYAKNFNLTDDIIIVAKSKDADDRNKAIEHLASLLGKDPDFKELLYKVDKSEFESKVLYYAPKEDLQKLKKQLEALQRAKSITDLYRMYPESADLFTKGALKMIDEDEYVSPWNDLMPLEKKSDDFKSEYMTVANLSFLQLRATSRDNQFDPTANSVKKIRHIVERIKEKHPDVEFGLTGLPVLESDEMAAAQESNNVSTIISFIGTALLFILGFGKIKNPTIVVINLCMCLCYAFGAITFFIGHLNILSMFFVPMIIGIGIDYGIYLISVYDGFISAGIRKAEAIEATMQKVIPSITAGALTTAAGFAATYFSPFLGLKELGITAAIGIIVCFIATLLTLPSMIILFADEKKIDLKYDVWVYNWMMSHQRQIFMCCAILIGAMCFSLKGVNYNRDLSHLQPDSEAVRLERYISKKTGMSAWYTISLCDNVQECERKKKLFEKLPMVSKVETVASMLPKDQEAKRKYIQALHNSSSIIAKKEAVLVEPRNAGRIMNSVLPDTRASAALGSRLDTGNLLRGINPNIEKNVRAFSKYQVIVFKELAKRGEAIEKMSAASPMTIEDVPSALKTRFVGQNGQIAMHIYCKDDLWIFKNLDQFVKELRKVDPELTGHPVGYYEATLQMEASYKSILTWGFVGIILILLFLMKDIALTFVTLIPLVIGAVFTLSFCKIFGIHLNTANIIAFPIILGTGIDNAIHLVGEYMKTKEYIPSYATARGAFFACTTTIVGFGALFYSSHKGLVGLGQIVCIGMVGCLIGTLIMSYLLNWWRENHPVE